VLLLSNAAAGAGSSFEIRCWGNREINHLYTLFVWGTFGGATVTLEISFDGVEWFAVSGVSVTAKSALNVEFRARFVRAVITGGAGVTLNALLN
jgi:hypothetical protein